MFGLAAVVLTASWLLAAGRVTSECKPGADSFTARKTRKTFTTGEPGDVEGTECLACPRLTPEVYRANPTDHLGPLSEAEEFMLDYWKAMQANDYQWVMDHYAGSGMLLRAGGPALGGNWRTPIGALDKTVPIDVWAPITAEGNLEHAGWNYNFYTQFLAQLSFRGHGGPMSMFTNNTGGMKVALQDVVHLSDDFAIVSSIVNGTAYTTPWNPMANQVMIPWQSYKTTTSVRKFPGVGWRIVQFTCSLFNVMTGECPASPSSGIPGPHVDWSGDNAYAVKFTDQANYCSRRCPCGEAPVSENPSSCEVPEELPYKNNVFVTETVGLMAGGVCNACPVPGVTPTFPRGSPERFAVKFVDAMGAGDAAVLGMYSANAVVFRNVGPLITSPTGNGGEFFTSFWPGLSFVGTGGALSRLTLTVHRSQHIGDHHAEVLVFTNGTLYFNNGTVAVPWIAKKISLVVTAEHSQWKVVQMNVLDWNTNGVDYCTHDLAGDYCNPKCPCGESFILGGAAAKAESTSYYAVQAPPGRSRASLTQRVQKHLRPHARLGGDETSMLQLPLGLTEEL